MHKRLLFLISLLILSISKINAQCNYTISSIGSSSIINATCIGNGQITVGSVSPAIDPATGDKYQYELRLTDSSTVVSSYGDNNVFSAVNAGEYLIYVRRVCNTGGFSNPIVQKVIVNSSYTPQQFASTAVTLERVDVGCGTGRFKVNVQNPNPNLMYALVSSQAAPHPAGSYVRAPQSSNIFDDLPAGTYYPRVIDACGNAITTTFTLDAFTASSSPKNTILTINPVGCDSMLIYLSNFRNFVRIQNTSDSENIKMYVIYPDGSSDTMFPMHYTPATGYTNSTSIASKLVHISKLDPNYDNSQINIIDKITNWPLNFSFGMIDQCGNVFNQSTSVSKLSYQEITDNFDENHSRSTCDSVVYNFKVTFGSPFGTTYYHLLSSLHGDAKYSLDTGVTWHSIRTQSTYFTSSFNQNHYDNIILQRDKEYEIQIDICGQIFKKVIKGQSYPTYSPTVSSTNQYSCTGTSSIYIYKNINRQVHVEVLSVPTGMTVPSTFSVPSNISSYIHPSLSNAIPGTYSFRIWDSIGVLCARYSDKTFIVNNTNSKVFDYNISQDCDKNFINAVTDYDFSTNGSYTSQFMVEILDNTGTNRLIGPVLGSSIVNTNLYKARIDISALANGVSYIIRGYKESDIANPELKICTRKDVPFVKGSLDLNLNSSRFVPGCPGGSATIVAQAVGGNKPYTFTLTDKNGLVVPSVNGEGIIYNDLLSNETYNLQVIDSCGTVISRSMQMGGNVVAFVSSHTTMPCYGDDVQLEMQNLSNTTYQWYHNDVAIPGATNHYLNLVSLNNNDSGMYTAEFTMGTCVVMTSAIKIDPDLCGAPLGVTMDKFDIVMQNNMPKLIWSTVSEVNNDYFIIERSNSKNNWMAVGKVHSKAKNGNADFRNTYEYIDATRGLNGKYLYRLKQVDIDGTTSYSTINSVFISNNTDNIVIHPNPSDRFISIQGIPYNTTVEFIDVSGKSCQIINNVDASKQIDVSNLQQGAYFIKIKTDDNAESYHKFIKM